MKLEALLHQRSTLDIHIDALKIKVDKSDVTIRDLEMKVQNLQRSIDGNKQAKDKYLKQLEDAITRREELSKQIESYNG